MPSDAAFLEAAHDTGFKPYKLPTCPSRFLWRSTMAMVVHPLFVEAVMVERADFVGRGLLAEPSNWTQMVRYARGELDAFQQTNAQAEAKRRRPMK